MDDDVDVWERLIISQFLELRPERTMVSRRVVRFDAAMGTRAVVDPIVASEDGAKATSGSRGHAACSVFVLGVRKIVDVGIRDAQEWWAGGKVGWGTQVWRPVPMLEDEKKVAILDAKPDDREMMMIVMTP